MDFKNIIPAHLQVVSEIQKKMDEIKLFNPISPALEQAMAVQKIYEEKFGWMSEFTEKLAVIQSFNDKLENRFLQHQAILQLNNFPLETFKPVIPNVPIIEFSRLEKIWEKAYSLSNDEWILESSPFDEEDEESSETVSPLYLSDSKKIKSIIESVWRDNQELYTIKPRDFEKLTAELLRHQGFETQLTKQTRDGGYDIWAIISIKGLKPFKMLVECKRQRNDRPVGIEIVRSFRTVLSDEHAHRGMIVTTSYFSEEVRKKEAEIPYLLECKDRTDIIGWIQDYKTINKG